jgi:hypothetical protein
MLGHDLPQPRGAGLVHWLDDLFHCGRSCPGGHDSPASLVPASTLQEQRIVHAHIPLAE